VRLIIGRKLADPIIIVCVESNPPMGCVNIPPTPEICINFVGSLAIFNKRLSRVEVPAGLVCTFFE
jgi:hypothetical protein